MHRLALVCLALSGCSTLFGLEAPVRGHDASPGDAALDAPSDADDAAAPPLDAPLDAPGCPVTYASIANSTTKYRVVTVNDGWEAAAADCADDGATTHLVVLGSSAELTAIGAAFSGVNDHWIGLSDRVTDGTFLWVTTEDTMGYPPATGGPWQTGPGSAPCVTAKDGNQFETRDCGLNRPYLCECDAFADDASRY